MKKNRREAGFSLMELLVVVLIIGLLSSIGIPVLVRSLRKSHRAAVGTSMRDVYVAMTRYYADNGNFPVLDTTTFEPLIGEGYLTHSKPFLSKLQNDSVLKYYALGSAGWWLIVKPKGDPESFIFAGRVDLTGGGGTIVWDGIYWFHPTETPKGLVPIDKGT
jgi:prepilin-type N-terminal cleavage/methylation domain-containing protein